MFDILPKETREFFTNALDKIIAMHEKSSAANDRLANAINRYCDLMEKSIDSKL